MYLRIISIIFLSLTIVGCGKKSPIEPPDPTKLSKFEEVAQVELIWDSTITAGAGEKQARFSNILPVIRGGQLLSASVNGVVASLDKNTGKAQWSRDLGTMILAGVGEENGVTVVVTSANKVVGLDTRTGDQIWEQMITQTVFAPPLVHQGSVVLRTIDGDVLCLDAHTGEFLWDAIFDQPPFVVHGSPRPLALGNLALIGNAEGRIYAIDLLTGFESWQVYLASARVSDVGRQAEAPLQIAGDHIYIVDPLYAVLAYSLSQGNLVWRSDRDVTRKLAVGRTQVFGIDRDGVVFALARANGQLLWEQKSFQFRKISNVAALESYVIFDDGEGYLHVLDAISGHLAARIRSKKAVQFDGFLTEGNILYVAYKSGAIDAYRIRSK